MTQLDFSSQADPVATPSAPDFSADAEPVKKVGALSMAGRQFVAGGGDLINALGSVNDALDPGSRMVRGLLQRQIAEKGAELGKSPAEIAQAQLDADPAASLATNAHQFGDLAPGEVADGLGARVAGGAARMIPNLAGAIATGGESSLAGLVPNAARAVPVLGRVLTGVAAGAPTAAALTGIQSTNLPAGMSTGEKVATTAKDLGINLAMAGLPLAVGASPMTRALTGGAIGYGGSAASSAIQGQPQDQAQNIVGGMMGALMGQHSAEIPGAPLDPYIARYNASAGESAPSARPGEPARLPAPDFASQAEPVTPATPAPTAAPVAPAPEPFNAKLAETIFKADPRTALAALDHSTLVQVAKDAGFSVGPGEGPASIIGKIVSQPTAFIHSDVLPEYMAAISPVSPTPETAPAVDSQAPMAQNMAQASELSQPQPPQSMASLLAPNTPLAVDSAGTAYTPDQGMGQILAGMDTSGARPALPAPVTTVDSYGNAKDSGSFLRQAREVQDAADAAMREKANKATLGITPDIERTQALGWKAREAAQADIQARHDARDAANGDLATQRTDDAPPWWLAGEHATDEQSQHEQDQMVGQREDDSPPWWLAGQHAADVADAEMRNQHPGSEPSMPVTTPIDATHDVPLGGGVSRDGQKVYIAKQIPETIDVPNDQGDMVPVNAHEVISQHERAEGPQLRAGKRYADAHDENANSAEAAYLNDRYGVTHAAFNTALAPYLKEAKTAGAHSADIPHDLDTKPYVDGGDEAMLEPHKLAQPKELQQPDGSAGDDSVPVSKRRDDWSPRVEKKALTEIDSLVQRYGGSTLADSIAQDFHEHQAAALIGQTITSHEDLAAIASVYRNPAFETARYMFVDDAGTILGESAVSSRMPSSAVMFPTGEDDGAVWLIKAAPPGSTGVWMVHNHPSGNPRPSTADLDETGSLAISLGDIPRAPKMLGHVVLDHDTFGRISPSGQDMGIGKLPGKGADPLRQRAGADLFDVRMSSPAFAASTGKQIAALTPEDSTAVVIMGATGHVVSVHTFPNEVLASPRGAALLSRLGAKRGAVGIGLVTTPDAFATYRDQFAKASNRNLLYDAVVVTPSGHALQLGNHPDLMPQRALYGRQSAAASKRGNTGSVVRENAPPTESSEPLLSLSRIRQLLAERGMPQDQVDAMSRDQLRAEQVNFRARSAPTPDTTGIKNATVAEERAMKGDAEVEHDLSRTDQQGWDEAKARLANDPNYGTDLAASFVKKPRPATKEETFALTLDRMRISKERRAAYDTAETARTSGTQSDQLRSQQRIDALDAQMEANDVAGRVTGYETASGLAARRALTREDYSMANLITQGKVKAGRALTSEERSDLEQRAKAIEEREAAVAKREAELRTRRRSATVSDKTAASSKSRFDDLAAQLKKIAEKDQLKAGCIS